MKEYIKTFMTPSEGDKYDINNIPWMGYVDSTGQNLVCNEENKRTINQNGTLVIQDGPEFVDLGLSVKWAKYNYGVNPEQLTSVSDWYGKYLSWGELEEKAGWDGQGTKVPYDWVNYKYANGDSNKLTKYCNNPQYGNDGYVDNLTTLEPMDDVAAVNYGGTWRMPTQDELGELMTLSSQWITNYNDVSDLNGRLFTGTNGNQLFIPAAGYRIGSNTRSVGSLSKIRSSSLLLDVPNLVYELVFNSSGHLGMNTSSRALGLSVRPVLVNS